MQSAQLVKELTDKIKCSECQIRSYSFCRCLKDNQLKNFSEISTSRKFNNKENIFLQGDVANNLYNITEGNVKIYELIEDGRIQIIEFLYPGDFFGSFKKDKYNYCAEAIGDSKVCIFEKKKLDSYMENNFSLARELLNQTSQELALIQDSMKVLGKFDATEKLSKFIFNITEQRKRIGLQNNPISLPMTRQDIADYLGLTIETVSREITKLKTSNIIKIISSKQIFINDFEKLLKLSN